MEKKHAACFPLYYSLKIPLFIMALLIQAATLTYAEDREQKP